MRGSDNATDLPTTAELVDFLMSPATHGLKDGAVRLIETHGAYVYLAGTLAYKMKKPVDFGYFDFTTLKKREADSRREVDLNRRSAPGIYRRVVPVTRGAMGALRLDGSGMPVEWLVEMTRFDETQVLDVAVARDKRVLSPALIDALARAVAKFHREAEIARGFGGADAMAGVIRANDEQLNELADAFESDGIHRLASCSLGLVERRRSLLDARREAGHVRRCHGDLHLGNIVLVDDKPVLFDCIEFSDDFACIDVLYDLAFLIMDLDHRGYKRQANQLFNRYLLALDDDRLTATLDGLALMPLFLSCRAAVRAHVTARQSRNRDLDAAASRTLADTARRYLADALRYLDDAPPRLVAIGGLSGSGKSTVARALAPELGNAPGAVLLRSDELRKRRFGVDPLTRLNDSAYGAETSAAVYEDQRRLAGAAIAAGHSVVADAVFARAHEREAIERAAASAAFNGVWLNANRVTLAARLSGRTGDASDADVAVLERQLAYDVGPLSWPKIDATAPVDAVVRAVKAILR